MKNSVVLVCFLITVFATSCKKITEFRVKDSSEFVVPQTAALGATLLDTMSVSTSSAYEFQSQGTDTKNIKDVKLSRLTLTIKSPAGETFSFLNSIRLYIYAEGLPEAEIAYLDNIPATVGSSIELNTTGAKLDEYIKKDNYNLRVKTETDEILTQDITVQSDMTFLVRAKLI